VDKSLIGKDVHLKLPCKFCHQGNDRAATKNQAHQGLVKKPSDDLRKCAMCHKQITQTYAKSLHYTSAGQREGVRPRFSPAEFKVFQEKVFEQSCRSCHATCGDCHVKSPPVSGIGLGLIKGHKFVKRDEGRTCAFCHGGRVYPEFTGEFGGSPDVHYQKGIMCMDCHKKAEMHGDGTAYPSRHAVKDRPACRNCHPSTKSPKLYVRAAHEGHAETVSCQGCHSSSQYRDCSNCHNGHSTSSSAFHLGLNPRDRKRLTTLRLIPTVRDTFAPAGIKMEHFDALPNYWDSAVHNIRKRTDRTRNCDACHVERAGFLTREQLIKNGSLANRALICPIQPLRQ
jgi:hypothetical protein